MVLLMKYISTWGWFILSWIFFTSSIILLSLPDANFMTFTFSIVFFMLFILCLFKSLKKRMEVLEYE